MLNIHRRGGLASSLLITALVLPATGYSDTIYQSVSNPSSSTQTSWNSAIWGTPTAAAPVGGNDYVTVAGGFSAAQTYVGTTVTGRVREDGETFLGNSITVEANTEILIKGNAVTSTGNIILDGGVLRYAPNSAGTATVAGTLNVVSESYLGLSQTGTSTFNVNSTLTGSGLLHLAAGSSSGTPILNLILGGDLSGYTGTFDLGGSAGSASNNKITLSFSQDYTLSAGLEMGQYSTADVLDLNYDLTVGSFTFGATTLDAGTYDVSTLNTDFGNGAQFAGTGTLTVEAVPEPGTIALASLGGGFLLLLGRRQKR